MIGDSFISFLCSVECLHSCNLFIQLFVKCALVIRKLSFYISHIDIEHMIVISVRGDVKMQECFRK